MPTPQSSQPLPITLLLLVDSRFRGDKLRGNDVLESLKCARSPDALLFRRSRAPSGSCRGRSHTPRDRWPRGWPPPSASDPPRPRCALLLFPRAYLQAQRCSGRAAAQPLPRHPRTGPRRGLRQRTRLRACDGDISCGLFSPGKYKGRLFRSQRHFLAATANRPSGRIRSMRFTKMQGCGNDFLIFDPGDVEGMDLHDLATKACDRHFGVGADGILIPAPSGTADLEMVYLNSDGSTSEMCGNGLRCLARYAKDRGIVEGEAMSIATGAGVKEVVLFEDGSSRVDMGTPRFGTEIGVSGFRLLRVSMGNPHAVAFLESEAAVEVLDLPSVGPPIEEDPTFPDKTNVEFAFARDDRDVRMRVW